MAIARWLTAALCLSLTVAPAALAQEGLEEEPGYEEVEVPEAEAAPQLSPAEIKKQLQNFKSNGDQMAGVQELARIARAIKANGGQMSLQDVKTLRTTLKQVMSKGSVSQNPLYADMMEQLDGALARLEKQIANPDGWDEEELRTE